MARHHGAPGASHVGHAADRDAPLRRLWQGGVVRPVPDRPWAEHGRAPPRLPAPLDGRTQERTELVELRPAAPTSPGALAPSGASAAPRAEVGRERLDGLECGLTLLGVGVGVAVWLTLVLATFGLFAGAAGALVALGAGAGTALALGWRLHARVAR